MDGLGLIGYESAGVNDQLVPVAPGQAFDPLVYGTIAEDMWPIQGSYQTPPVLSPFTNFGSVPPYAGYGPTGGSMGTEPTSRSETGSPWHLTKSPLWWAVGFLALSLYLLHKIFWKD